MSLLLGLVLATAAASPVVVQAENDWINGPTETLPSEDKEAQITLYIDSYAKAEDGTREIRFLIKFPEVPSEDMRNSSVTGLVQVKCANRKYRNVEALVSDGKGKTTPIPSYSPNNDGWDTLANHGDDKQIYDWICNRP